MMVRVMALFLAALVFAPPASASERPGAHVDLRIQTGGIIEAQVTYSVEGIEAGLLRGQVDSSRDGNITAVEAENYRNHTQNLAARARLGPPGGLFLINGTLPARTAILQLTIGDVEGKTARDDPVAVEWLIRMEFADISTAGFRLEVDTLNVSRAGELAVDVASAQVRAPPGYVISASGGLPLSASVAADKMAADFPGGFGNAPLITLMFEAAPARAAGGAEIFVGLLGLVVATRGRAARASPS